MQQQAIHVEETYSYPACKVVEPSSQQGDWFKSRPRDRLAVRDSFCSAGSIPDLGFQDLITHQDHLLSHFHTHLEVVTTIKLSWTQMKKQNINK